MKTLSTLAKIAVVLLGTACLAACDVDGPAQAQSTRSQQARKAQEAAQQIQFDDNAEIDNIKKRLMLTGDPGKLGFILLLNDAGQAILYEGVKGKVTSGGKRLTEPDRVSTYGNGNGGTNAAVRQAPSDEGTWGSSSPYIYYWNTDGVYRQWSGHYLYSDQPIRLRTEPLVINIQSTAAK